MSMLKQILPVARRAGEEYASFDDLVASEDTLSYDVRVPWWFDRNGIARLIRVRGLSLEDEVAVEKAGRLAAAAYRKQYPHDDLAPRSDWQAEYVEVLQRGVVRVGHPCTYPSHLRFGHRLQHPHRFAVAVEGGNAPVGACGSPHRDQLSHTKNCR